MSIFAKCRFKLDASYNNQIKNADLLFSLKKHWNGALFQGVVYSKINGTGRRISENQPGFLKNNSKKEGLFRNLRYLFALV